MRNKKAASLLKRLFVAQRRPGPMVSNYSFTAATGLAAGFALAILPPFMQHDGVAAMPPFMAQASFLSFLSTLAWPSWAKAVVPAKANRAMASRDFFMGNEVGLGETKGENARFSGSKIRTGGIFRNAVAYLI